MQKIVPHLWFDKEAAEAARFYCKIFVNSAILNETRLGGTPSGDVELLSVRIAGLEFQMISAGPYFRFTPAISFLVSCDSDGEVDRLWASLNEGGRALMPLDEYPFSPRYGWTEDRYGLSWQIMHDGGRRAAPKITPTMMFTGDRCGKAEEAILLYASTLPDSELLDVLRYGVGAEPDAPDSVKHAAFRLCGQEFAAMDSAYDHRFGFNEAISFMVRCDSQEEIDRYWSALSAVPEAEQCGWLKDRFGVSWQIVPSAMEALMSEADDEGKARITRAFLAMKKFDLPELEKAARG